MTTGEKSGGSGMGFQPSRLPTRGPDSQASRFTLTKPVTAVCMFCCILFGLAALLMFRFVRVTLGKPALAGERRDVSSVRP
jgi:hypothetical protein